jgi:cysteine desulfurase
VEGESLVTGLLDLAVSTGSACNSASAEPSYVLRALGRDTQLAQSSLRFSVGRYTTAAEVDYAIDVVRREVERLRALSPASEDAQPPVAIAGASGHIEPSGAAGAVGEEAAQPVAARGQAESAVKAALAPTDWDARPGEPIILSAEAGGPGEETWVRFHLTVEGGIVKAARFKAYGCPHTLAVLDWLRHRLLGRKRVDGPPGTPATWSEELSVPVEKLGRLLVVEDALLACFARWPSGA